MTLSVNMSTLSIGTYWTSTIPPKRFIFKITTLENNEVYFDIMAFNAPDRIRKGYNSLEFFVKNYIPLINDEV